MTLEKKSMQPLYLITLRIIDDEWMILEIGQNKKGWPDASIFSIIHFESPPHGEEGRYHRKRLRMKGNYIFFERYIQLSLAGNIFIIIPRNISFLSALPI